MKPEGDMVTKQIPHGGDTNRAFRRNPAELVKQAGQERTELNRRNRAGAWDGQT
jgi:hypothetical protein